MGLFEDDITSKIVSEMFFYRFDLLDTFYNIKGAFDNRAEVDNMVIEKLFEISQ